MIHAYIKFRHQSIPLQYVEVVCWVNFYLLCSIYDIGKIDNVTVRQLPYTNTKCLINLNSLCHIFNCEKIDTVSVLPYTKDVLQMEFIILRSLRLERAELFDLQESDSIPDDETGMLIQSDEEFDQFSDDEMANMEVFH